MTKTLTLVFAFLLSANIISHCAYAQDFSVKTDFTTGNTPYSVSFGDFNGDGKPDMVTANYTANTFSVLMNTTTPGAAAPTFSAATDFTTGTGPYAVALGDLNGDGKYDVAVANYDAASVSVFFNTTTPGASTPTFSAKTDFTTGTNPASVSFADFNGDGKTDMVIANYGSNTVSVLFNTTTSGSATPTFSAKTDFTTGTGPYAVATGDFNGDGKQDVATANYDGASASIFLNTTTTGSAAPTFSEKTDFTAGTNPASVAIRDLNGDGVPDLAVANYGSNSISVFINTTTTNASTPTFSAKTDFATESGPYAVTLGDINNDGKPDMAATNYTTNKVSQYFNITTPGASTPSFGTVSNYTVGSAPSSVTICDLNGDFKPDLAIGNETTNNVSVFMNIMTLGVASATFSARTDFTMTGVPIGTAIGDFNLDGKPDLAAMISNAVSVFMNTTPTGNGSPSFSGNTNFSMGTLTGQSIFTGDFNGDGKPDLVAGSNGLARISVFLNTTTPGGYPPSFSAKVDLATNSLISFIVSIADLNGDGKPDLAVASAGTAISVFINTTTPGSSTPSFTSKTDFTVGSTTRVVAICDLNGDGKPDLISGSSFISTASVLFNTTTPGALTPTFTARTDFAIGTTPRSISCGDVNGDGKPDILVGNAGSATVSILLNTTPTGNSTPSFSAATNFTTGTNPQSLSIGDLNGDGKPDFAVINVSLTTASVFLNTTSTGSSTPTYAPRVDLSAGTNPKSVSIGDLNGDGKPDLLVSSGSPSLFSVYFNTASLPLPVELASFTSSVNSNNVTLNWSTTQEQNNKGFEIERNSFGAGWKKVGYVEGNGTTNTPQNYTFKDNSLNTGRYSYRLKQIDFNGNFEYFELSNEVAIGVPNRYSLAQNYPNPFNPVTKINYELPFDCKVSIKIFDMTSREVAQIVNATQTAGYYTAQFNGTNLASGVYFYKIIAEGGNAAKFVNTKKMVLVK